MASKTRSYIHSKPLLLVLLILLYPLFLAPIVSAFEFDNVHQYSENDMKITFKNSFLGIPTTTIGNARLKSHNSVDEIKWVGSGEQIVMFYEFDFNNRYNKGLGTIEFIDMKTGNPTTKSYNLVRLANVTKVVSYEDCDDYLAGKSGDCTFLYNGTEEVEEWIPLEDDDIPEGVSTIGLQVVVAQDEYVDAIWNIAGRRVTRHAIWREVDAITEAHGEALGSSSSATAWRGMNISIGSESIVLVNLTKHADTVTNGTCALFNGTNQNQIAFGSFSGNICTFSTAPTINATLEGNQTYAIVVYTGGTVRYGGVTYPISGTYLDWTKGIFNGLASQNDEVNEIVSIGVAPIVDYSPVITLVGPANHTNSTIANIVFDATITDEGGVGNVTLFIDGIANETNTSGVNGSYSFSKEIAQGNHNWSIGAVNTIGNTANSSTQNLTIDWMFFDNQSYNTTITEGVQNYFFINVTTNGSSNPTIANLTYNGTQNLGAFSTDGNVSTLTYTHTAPLVDSSTNVSFYWNLTLANGYYGSSPTSNQTVNPFGLDNCSVNSVVLYNFTQVTEKTQLKINESFSNQTADVDIQLYSLGRASSLINYSNKFNETNPFSICVNTTLSAGETYNLDAQIQYDADGYASEFYHIQNATIDSTDLPTNITLYDLNDDDAQEFKVTYKDTNFLPVEDALVVVTRKYIAEGVFKTVEIAKTDENGETLVHLELSDAVYTFNIIKNGVTLATFDNVLAVCNNVATGDCELSFNSFSSTFDPKNFILGDDFQYTLTYDSDARDVATTFSIPSGNPSTIVLNVSLFDMLGNTSICSESLTSASGSLNCTIANNFGNGSITADLFKDGTRVGGGIIKLQQNKSDIYGTSVVFLGLFLMLTVIGVGVGSSALVTGMFLILGGVLSIALNLVDSTGFIGPTATILWLIIAVVLVLIKGSNRQ